MTTPTSPEGSDPLERLLQGSAAPSEQVVDLAPASIPLTVVVSRAESMGWDVMVVDGRAAIDKTATLQAFATGCGFPDWFGHNLDALADSLSDLSWRPDRPHLVVWTHAAAPAAADPALAGTIRVILSETGPAGRFGAVLA